MKNLLRFFCFSILFFAIILKGFAIGSPTNIAVESNDNNGVVLTWDEIEGALAYDLYYRDIDGPEDDISTVDLIEENTVVVEGLEVGKTYSFTVIAYDDSGETGDFSEEVLYDVIGSEETTTVDENTEIDAGEDFILKSVSVLAYDKLELEFSANLNDSEDAVREFKIENIEDMFDTYEVLDTELNEEDQSKIELTLDKNLTIGNEYEVVIVAITSSEGNNIESGIDNSETVFVDEIDEKEEVELNAASEDDEEIVEEAPTTSIAGTNIDVSEIENTTLGAAANQDNLPQTGPEHVLMLVLSIILGSLIFVFKFKRS